MRIVAGDLGGRTIETLAGEATRPTSGMVRGAMFNILGPRIAGARVLDLYAGSGAIGLEALSRGAEHVTMVERAADALRVIERNVAALGVSARTTLVRGDVGSALMRLEGEFEVAIADPPYRSADWPALLTTLQDLSGLQVVLIEFAKGEIVPERVGKLSLAKRYAYGATHLALFRPTTS